MDVIKRHVGEVMKNIDKVLSTSTHPPFRQISMLTFCFVCLSLLHLCDSLFLIYPVFINVEIRGEGLGMASLN